MDSNEGCNFYEMQIGTESCMVNRNQQTLQKITRFEDIYPLYNEEYGLHFMMEDGTIYPLNKCVIGYTKVLAKYNSDSEYFHVLCETKRKHIDAIMRSIYGLGLQKPSMVQTMGLLPLINGQDSIIQFKSGTGKTFTFLIGLLWGFDPANESLQYIFLTSTHEVASQIFDLVQKIVPGANVSLCIGGTKQQAGGFKTNNRQTSLNEKRLELKKAQIIVGTVGKTYEFMCIKKMIPSVEHVRAICMDEFDQLISPQKTRNSSYEVKTEDQVRCILSSIPEYAQRVFFSATVIPDSDKIARSFFRPYDEDVGEPFMLLLSEDNFVVTGIRHYYVTFGTNDDKCDALVELWGRMRNGGQGIIFVNRTDSAYKLQTFLETELKGVTFGVFHGGIDGPTRDKIFQDFKSGACRYLISTDVLSRGIDVQSINFVINFDMPDKLETYIHRIGRGGRYGRKNIVINFILVNQYMNEMLKVNAINEEGQTNKMESLRLMRNDK